MGDVLNATVRCSTCEREERVSFSYCLSHGWPACHGMTMTLVSHEADAIEQAVADAFGPVSKARNALPEQEPS